MPQEFRVVRCYQCDVFQVQMVKKSNKWKCVICGDNQSLKQVYGTGSGKECRLHVQKLNEIRMHKDLNTANIEHEDNSFTIKTDSSDGASFTQVPENISQNNYESLKNSNFLYNTNNIDNNYSQLNVNDGKSLPLKNNTMAISKWAKYLENEPKHSETESYNDDLFNGVQCVLELPSNKKSRKTPNNHLNKDVKKFKSKSESLKDNVETFEKENDNIQSCHGSDDEEYWDKVTKVNECWEEVTENQFDFNEGADDIKPEIVGGRNVMLSLNTNYNTSKWSKYVTDVDKPKSHNNCNLLIDESAGSSKLLNYDSNPIIQNKNTEFGNKMVSGVSKCMKYIETPETISIQTNGDMINNHSMKRSNDINENTIKTSKWAKYLDTPDPIAESAVDHKPSPQNKNEDLSFKDSNKVFSHTEIEPFKSNNKNSMDLINCKVLNKSNHENHVENGKMFNIGSKTDIKSALSKFKIDKLNVKTKNTKYSSSVSTENSTKYENSKYVFDSFLNSDDADLENMFDL